MARSRKISVCVPVLMRYDLLYLLVESLRHSTIHPDVLCLIDNGRNYRHLEASVVSAPCEVIVSHPHENLGVACSWNTFLRRTDEERIICNDDIEFAPDSIARMVSLEGQFITGLPDNAFSCFLIRDECIERVGYFDETISPNYGYFEDCDYLERMKLARVPLVKIDCGIRHGGSKTLERYSAERMLDHHRRFIVAQTNFIKKWGRLPPGVEEQHFEG